jgi:hypothetical protein
MKAGMQTAQSQLDQLLEAHEATAGMYVRIHGNHLIAGRKEALGPDNKLEDDDRVRLTRLDNSTFGLSVKRHTGRWEKTPFSGSMKEMVDVIQSLMQHLVSVY